jgi:hypothetical protein
MKNWINYAEMIRRRQQKEFLSQIDSILSFIVWREQRFYGNFQIEILRVKNSPLNAPAAAPSDCFEQKLLFIIRNGER